MTEQTDAPDSGVDLAPAFGTVPEPELEPWPESLEPEPVEPEPVEPELPFDLEEESGEPPEDGAPENEPPESVCDDWGDPDDEPPPEDRRPVVKVVGDVETRTVSLPEAQEELRNIFQTAVDYALEEPGRAAVVDLYPPGCLSGGTEIIVNRGGGARRMPLRRVVQMQNGGWDSSIPTRTASFYAPYLRLNTIVAAVASGRKTTWRLRTKGGRSIRATTDHLFWTSSGWRRLGAIKPGDVVIVRGPNLPGFHTETDTILSIDDPHEEETFDLTMDPSSQSFVANGFVAHNSGKTRQAVYEVLRSGAGGSIIAPTHSLLDEIEEVFFAVAQDLGQPPPPLVHLRSSLKGSDWLDVLQPWAERKWQVQAWLAMEGEETTTPPPPPPGSIVLAPHAMLPILTKRARREPSWLPDPIIIDELPKLVSGEACGTLDVSLLTGSIQSDRLQQWANPRRDLARTVIEAARLAKDYGKSRWGKRVSDELLAELLVRAADGEERLRRQVDRFVRAHEQCPSPPAPHLARVLSRKLSAHTWPRFDTDAFLLALLSAWDPTLKEHLPPGARGAIGIEHREEEPSVWLEYKYASRTLPQGRSAIVLDATAGLMDRPLRAYMKLSGFDHRAFHLRVRDAEDYFRVAFIQTKEAAAGRAYFGTNPAARAEALCRHAITIGAHLLQSIGFAAGRKPKIALITYARLEWLIRKHPKWAGVRGAFRKASSDKHRFRTGHFYGPIRGSNKFLDNDLLIVFGDPKKNLGVVQEEAKVLGTDADYYMLGLCGSEAEQVIHRLRLIRSTAETPKAVVYIGAETPPHWKRGKFLLLAPDREGRLIEQSRPWRVESDEETGGRPAVWNPIKTGHDRDSPVIESPYGSKLSETLGFFGWISVFPLTFKYRDKTLTRAGVVLANHASEDARRQAYVRMRAARLRYSRNSLRRRQEQRLFAAFARDKSLVQFTVRLGPGRPFICYATRKLTEAEVGAIQDVLIRKKGK